MIIQFRERERERERKRERLVRSGLNLPKQCKRVGSNLTGWSESALLFGVVVRNTSVAPFTRRHIDARRLHDRVRTNATRQKDVQLDPPTREVETPTSVANIATYECHTPEKSLDIIAPRNK